MLLPRLAVLRRLLRRERGLLQPAAGVLRGREVGRVGSEGLLPAGGRVLPQRVGLLRQLLRGGCRLLQPAAVVL